MMGRNLTWLALALVWGLSLSQQEEEVHGTIGSQATMPCSMDFLGQNVQVVWTNQDRVALTMNTKRLVDDTRVSVDHHLAREWNLVIDNLRASDEGAYQCLINTQPPKSKTIHLIIDYPPTISGGSPREVRVSEGDTVDLVCNATGVPTPTVTWYTYDLDGSRQELFYNTSTFTLHNVTKVEGRKYACIANNGVTPAASKTVTLIVGFAPLINIPYQRISQERGKDTLLECIITANPVSDANLYWRKDSESDPLISNDKYNIRTSLNVGKNTHYLQMFIYDLKVENFGAYTCGAKNEYGSSEGTIQLYEYKSQEIHVEEPPGDMIATLGAKIIMNCTVEGLTHNDNLIWWFQGTSGKPERLFVSHIGNIPEKDVPQFNVDKYQIIGHYNLLIENVTFYDAGTYMCEILGFQNYSAQLTVVGPPLCEGNNTVTQGTEAELTCGLDLAGPAPNWRVDWEVGAKKLSSVNLDSSSRLHRQVAFIAMPDDEGHYVCVISSQYPPYQESCETEIYVSAGDASSGWLCQHNSGSHVIQMPLALAIFGGALFLLFVLFSCLLCSVVIHYRRKLNGYREKHPKKRFRNGHLGGDTERQTLTAPNADQLEAEVDV